MGSFKISACTANYGHADLFKIIDRLAELKFDGIELTVMYHAVPAETSAQRRKEIRKRLSDAGLNLAALHFIFASGMRMTSNADADRAKVVDHVGSVVDLAADLGAPAIVIGGGGVRSVPQGEDKELGVARVVDTLGRIARKCETAGVVGCLEGLNRYETNVGRSLAECATYVDKVNSKGLKIAGDTFHMNIEESSIAAAIEAAGDRLRHLQLPDSHRMAPGGGHIDFKSVFRALKRIDYAGYLSFEIFWIAPDILYLPTWEACDAENAKGIDYVRKLEATL